MRLINVGTTRLEDFSMQEKPKYAILSHRWTENEVTYADVCATGLQSAMSAPKLSGMLQQAQSDGLRYAWVDTCCIDKANNTELSEAINSMYRWYEGAEVCYVYLHDVDKEGWEDSFPRSAWFTRGWTLQELLAPTTVVFYDRNWQMLGDKVSLADDIGKITGIDSEALETRDLSLYSIAQKMAWAAPRLTTRVEDQAYCLIGLFDVNMPLLYGEGERAFLRLQEEIVRHDDDHSIFAWSMDETQTISGMLAPSVHCFDLGSKIISLPSSFNGSREPFSVTNRGLSIKLNITPWYADIYLAFLNCGELDSQEQSPNERTGIYLRRLPEDDQYMRVKCLGKNLWSARDGLCIPHSHPIRERRLFVPQKVRSSIMESCGKDQVYGIQLSDNCLFWSASISCVNTSSDHRVATFAPGSWGCVLTVDLSVKHEGLRRIALGFDFDFNPVCFLQDSSTILQPPNKCAQLARNWTRVIKDEIEWKEVRTGSCVYQGNTLAGICALKGCRTYGLTAFLPKSVTDKGWVLSLRRDTRQSTGIWEFHIENLIGPFRSAHPRTIPRDPGSREAFLRHFGIGSTAKGFEGDDELLQILYPTVYSLKRIDNAARSFADFRLRCDHRKFKTYEPPLSSPTTVSPPD